MALPNLNLWTRVVLACCFATMMTMMLMTPMMIVTMLNKKLGDLNLSVRTGLGMLDCTLSGGDGMNIRPLGTQAKAVEHSSRHL